MRAGTLVVDIAANVARLQQDMAQAKDVVSRGMADIKSTVGDVKEVFAKLGVVLSAGVFVNTIRETIEMEAALLRVAQKSGSTVEAISSLSGVAKRSGADLDEVAKGMQKLSKSMAEAGDGTSKAGKVFDALKISTTDATGALRPAQQVMQELGTKLVSMKDQTLAVAFAQEVLGKAGANLLPFLYELAGAGELQAKVTTEQAEAAKRFEDGLQKLQAGFTANKVALANELLPFMQTFLDQMVAGTQIAGGFVAAIRLFGSIDPGKSLSQNLASKQAELKDWQDAGPVGRFFKKPLGSTYAGTESDLQKQVRFLQFQRAQELSAELQGQHFAEDVQPGPKSNVANPLGKSGGASKDGEQMLISLRNQLASAGGEASVFDATMRALTEGTKKYSDATVTAALALAGEIDETKKLNKEKQDYARLQLEIFNAQRQFFDQQAQTIVQMEADNKRTKEQNEEIGKTTDQVNALRLARMDEMIVKAERDKMAQAAGGAEETEIKNLQREIDLLKERRELMASGQVAQSAADQAKAAEEAFKRTANTIDGALTTAIANGLMHGFVDKGKSIIDNFKTMVEDAFKTAVLTPIIRAVISPVAAGVAGMLPNYGGTATYGANGSAGSSGLGGIGSLLQTGSSASNLLSSGGNIWGTGAGQLAMGAGNELGIGVGYNAAASGASFGVPELGLLAGSDGAMATGSLAAAGAGELSGAAVAGGLATEGGLGLMGGAAAGLAAVPVAGWIALAALATYAVISSNKKKGGPKDSEGVLGFTRDDNQFHIGVNNAPGGTEALASLAAQFSDPSQYDQETLRKMIGVEPEDTDNPNGPHPRAYFNSSPGDIGALKQQLLAFAAPAAAVAQQRNANFAGGMQAQGMLVSSLQQFSDSQATSQYLAPMDRLAGAQSIFDSTLAKARGGDASAIQALGGSASSLLSAGRDVYASGPQFAELMKDVNKNLGDLLTNAQDQQNKLLAEMPASIQQAAQDQISAINDQTAALSAKFDALSQDVRSLAAAVG